MLVDGDDHNEPVADNIRGTLDGHIVLDRAIADQGRFPAVNVLSSVSRLANHAWSAEQPTLVMQIRAMIARYEDTRDLRLMGGYHRGTDPSSTRPSSGAEALRVDAAVAAIAAQRGGLSRARGIAPEGLKPAVIAPGCSENFLYMLRGRLTRH